MNAIQSAVASTINAAPAAPALGTALAAALAAAPAAVVAKPGKAKAKAKLTPADTIAANVGKANAEVIAEFVAAAEDYRAAQMECNALAETLVRYLWPRGASFTAWKPVIRAVRDLSDYAAMVLRTAYKQVHKALPSAGTGSGEGTKGMSAKRAVAALGTRINAVIAYLEGTVTANAENIPGEALDATATAASALLDAWQLLTAAIAEGDEDGAAEDTEAAA
jgi:hypothetical protein